MPRFHITGSGAHPEGEKPVIVPQRQENDPLQIMISIPISNRHGIIGCVSLALKISLPCKLPAAVMYPRYVPTINVSSKRKKERSEGRHSLLTVVQ